MKQLVVKKLKSPEEILEVLKKYFNKDRKFVFLWTVILAVITHFLLLSHLILSQDGLYNGIHYTAGAYEASLGRWGIDFFDSLRNNIAFPFITTMISIVLMGIVNVLLVDLFEIKGKIFKIFTILSTVVSPSLCMTLLYTYTADAYFFAMFFSVFTVYSLYKIKNKKLGIFLAIVSFVCMLGIYQSYMGITVGLILMMSMKKLLCEENSGLVVLKDIFIKAVILIVSAIAYFLLTTWILNANDIKMSAYGGMNQISIVTIFNSLITSLKSAYLGFIKYFFADGVILNRTWKREQGYLVFFILYFISMLCLFIKMKKSGKENKDIFIKMLLSAMIICVLPIALNLVVVLAPGNDIYYLTATQMTLMIPFVLMCMELLEPEEMMAKFLNWVMVIVLGMIMITYFLSIIVTYETVEISYNQAKSVANRVIDRMEEYPGYRSGMNSLFAGVIDDVNFPKRLDIYNFALTNSFRSSILHGTYQGQQNTWRNFIEIYCGIHINFCQDYEYDTIVNSEEFKEMNVFPGENSVRIIQDVMVVKFTDSPAQSPVSQNLPEHEAKI